MAKTISASPARSDHAAQRVSWGNPTSLFAVLATGVCVMVAGVLFFGRVTGTEFCPQTFELRDYRFFRAPITGWQITPVVRDIRTSGFIAQLRADGFVQVLSLTPRWDVVEVDDGGHAATGHAQILTNYLEGGPERFSRTWAKWSADHPELARRFWPLVQQATHAGAYAALPELFRTAANTAETSDPAALTAFSDLLIRVLIDAVASLANDASAAGAVDEARALYELALGHAETPELRRAYEQLGGRRSREQLQSAVQAMPLVAAKAVYSGRIPDNSDSNVLVDPAAAAAAPSSDSTTDAQVDAEVTEESYGE